MNADEVKVFVAACWPKAMQSPVAQACAAFAAADAASIACDAAQWGADDTAAMLREAESLAETWRHLGADEMREQVELHIASNWPDANDDLIDQIVSRVCN